MLFLVALAVAIAFSILCKKPLKQHPWIFYVVAVVITAIVSIADFRNVPTFVNTYIIGLFSRGALSTALWALIMWAGAFPNGSKPIKALMPIRGELSIFAAILTLGHNIGYGKTYFVRLFTDADHMSQQQLIASILTIIMLVIMIPLTVMSFPKVRKKMNAKLWKKIQRTAYLFYALIYIHIMVLFMPMAKTGRDGYFLSVIVYSAVFIGYAVCRIRKSILRKKPESTTKLNVICIFAFVILFAIPCVYAGTGSSNNSSSHNAVSTTNITTTYTTTVVTETSSEVSQTTVVSVTGTSVQTTVTETGTGTETTDVLSEEETEPTETEESEEDVSQDEESPEEDYQEPEQEEQPEPEPDPEPETEPEPVYIYNNGTYTASAYGYDGDVQVSVTIENDVIVSITGSTNESDSWYYDSAAPYVISQILASQNTQVDAYSGATYSSDAIMTAVADALNMARK